MPVVHNGDGGAFKYVCKGQTSNLIRKPHKACDLPCGVVYYPVVWWVCWTTGYRLRRRLLPFLLLAAVGWLSATAAGRSLTATAASGCFPLSFSFLLRSEDPVACITQSGDYVAVVIEVAVYCAGNDFDVGVFFLHQFYTRRGGEDCEELD